MNTQTTDFMDFQQELLQTTREAIELSNEYLKARKEYASLFNKIVVLLNKSGLDKSKKSVDNKIIELLSDKTYGELAQQIHAKMLEAESQYKGLENVLKAYMAHASAIQSIMKQQVSGEVLEGIKAKYTIDKS